MWGCITISFWRSLYLSTVLSFFFTPLLLLQFHCMICLSCPCFWPPVWSGSLVESKERQWHLCGIRELKHWGHYKVKRQKGSLNAIGLITIVSEEREPWPCPSDTHLQVGRDITQQLSLITTLMKRVWRSPFPKPSLRLLNSLSPRRRVPSPQRNPSSLLWWFIRLREPSFPMEMRGRSGPGCLLTLLKWFTQTL